MKRNLSQQLKKAAQETRMNEKERSLLHAKLDEFVSFHPLREIEETESLRTYFSEAYFAFRRVGVASVLLLLLVFTGGVSALADQALPGSIFYPLKTNFFEKARDVFVIGTEHKAEREVEKLAKRVDEAARLNAAGKLKEKEIEVLEVKMEAHEEKARLLADELRSDDEGGIALDIESDLDTELQAKDFAVTGRLALGASLKTSEAPEETATSLEEGLLPIENESPSMEATSASLRIAQEDNVNDERRINEDASGISTLSIQHNVQEEMIQGQEVEDFKVAASRKKASVHKLRSEARLMTALSGSIAPTYADQYHNSIVVPLEAIDKEITEAENAYAEERYEDSFNAYYSAHTKLRGLITLLKSGNWTNGEADESTIKKESDDIKNLTPSVSSSTESGASN